MSDAVDIISDLESRDMISQMTSDEELRKHLGEGPKSLYVGFDPTAESLHIGSLVPLLALKRFQLAGHKPIALVGGATGMIGDPSFKAAERKLNSNDIIEGWVEKIKAQVSQFLDFDCGENSAIVVNNLDWTKDYDVLSFLREIGKHFSVNAMIQKESVKQRIEREGDGISFTEFSYMILQSYDFAELYSRHNCTIQVGGSDQWGNITGGIDLTRRLHRGQVFGITLPLVTKSDGEKFGKTETGTIWLDKNKTSPYAFYQFWLNTADADVYTFLKYFSFLSAEQIADIEERDKTAQGKPEAQSILAKEVTQLVHGEEGLTAAMRISQALFSGEISQLNQDDLEQLRLDGLPSTTLGSGSSCIVEILVACSLAKSNKMAREFIGNGAVNVNGQVINTQDHVLTPENALLGKYFIIRRGKKLFHLCCLES